MPFPTENLHPQESLVLDLRPHWWTFTPSLVALVAAVVGGIWVLAATDSQPLRLVTAIVVLGCLVWFVTRYVQWYTTELVLTSDRLIYRSGVIAKSGIEIPLDRINTIFFNQKIWERLIGVGDLMVESASATGAQHFDNMKQPSRIQNEIYLQKEGLEERRRRRSETPASEPPPPPSSPAAGSDDVAARIMKLNELLEAGAITAEEYEAKKAELLGQL